MQSPLGRLRQQLSSLWGSPADASKQQQGGSLSSSALVSLKATAARWLAQKAEDPESREALLAFGSSRLLDFLVSTATEEPSPEQRHAEQAVVSAGLKVLGEGLEECRTDSVGKDKGKTVTSGGRGVCLHLGQA